MLLFSICLLGLFGVSLFTVAEWRRKPASVRSAYASPPADWPDVPVSALGLFRREGRINRRVVRSSPPPVPRLTSLQDAQAMVLARVGAGCDGLPRIALRLSVADGPSWTDLMLDDVVVARLPTRSLSSCSGKGAAPSG